MRTKFYLVVVLGGFSIAFFAAFHPTQSAQAQTCYDPQQQPIPCPEQKPKNTKTPIPVYFPPTPTATATETPTSTPTEITTDTSTPCVPSTWYRDADLDGYGTISGSTTTACIQPLGYASNSMDCNDTNASIHPGAIDVCGDGIDQDCDMSDTACSEAAPSSPNSSTVVPPGVGIPPWLMDLGILLLGILIGLLLPFRPGSFFNKPSGPANTPGNSSFGTNILPGRGTPGGGDDGGDPHAIGPKHDDLNPGGVHAIGPKHDDLLTNGEDENVGGGDDVSFEPKQEDPLVTGKIIGVPGFDGPGEGPDFGSGIDPVSERDTPGNPKPDEPNRPEPPQPPRLDGSGIGTVSTVGGPGTGGPGDVSSGGTSVDDPALGTSGGSGISTSTGTAVKPKPGGGGPASDSPGSGIGGN